jgi:uncharacterized protein with gpF-like domain
LKSFYKKAAKRATYAVSSFNTALYKDEQTSLGLNEYIWRTALDEKVRRSHRPLEGRICNWNDPTVYKNTEDENWLSRNSIDAILLHPGEDYNCRCYPEAIFSQLVD